MVWKGTYSKIGLHSLLAAQGAYSKIGLHSLLAALLFRAAVLYSTTFSWQVLASARRSKLLSTYVWPSQHTK